MHYQGGSRPSAAPVTDVARIGADYLRKARKAFLLLREDAWRRGLRAGTAATIEHVRLPLRSDYRSVIDVGANKGQFALYARVSFPEAQIYSLEPLSGPRAKLERLFKGDPSMHVLPYAAGAAPGNASIHVSRSDDSSSLLAMTSLQTERFPGTEHVSAEAIEVRRLDDLFAGIELPSPVLLKLDVQGFELEALRGATELITRVDSVLCECSFVPFYEGQALFEDIHAFMVEHGFGISGGAISTAAGNRWEQGDFVFERASVRQRAAA